MATVMSRQMPTNEQRIQRVAMAILFGAIAAPSVLHAQAPSAPPPGDTRGWISLAVGPGSADGRGRAAGNLALWVTHGPIAASVRYAGTSRLLEAGDMSDVSVLVGAHPVRERHIDGVVGIGAGQSWGHDNLGDLPRKPVIALGGQLNANYALIGVGVDAFAGVWSSRHYYGIGLALAIGAFP